MKKLFILLVCIISFSGCVSYNGQPDQIGSLIQDRDFYMRSHFRCTKMGKQIIEANKRLEERSKTNTFKVK